MQKWSYILAPNVFTFTQNPLLQILPNTNRELCCVAEPDLERTRTITWQMFQAECVNTSSVCRGSPSLFSHIHTGYSCTNKTHTQCWSASWNLSVREQNPRYIHHLQFCWRMKPGTWARVPGFISRSVRPTRICSVVWRITSSFCPEKLPVWASQQKMANTLDLLMKKEIFLHIHTLDLAKKNC